MALPSSGQLGMNQIRVELGISAQAPFSLDTAENGGYVAINQCSPSKPNPNNPAAISEWYGYDHNSTNCVGTTVYQSVGPNNCTNSCNNIGNPAWAGTVYTCGAIGVGKTMYEYTPTAPCSSVIVNFSVATAGGVCYTTNASGVIISSTNCTTPTPTPTATATPTPTPTATATPTPTPTATPAATPTPTPTPSGVTITVYTKQNTNGVGSGYQVYYRLNGCSGKGTWQQLTCGSCPTSDSCSACSGTISASSNQDISIAILDCSLGTGISFNASDNTSTCPSNAANYCDNADCTGTPFTFNAGTSNKNIAINVYTGKLGYLYCI